MKKMLVITLAIGCLQALSAHTSTLKAWPDKPIERWQLTYEGYNKLLYPLLQADLFNNATYVNPLGIVHKSPKTASNPYWTKTPAKTETLAKKIAEQRAPRKDTKKRRITKDSVKPATSAYSMIDDFKIRNIDLFGSCHLER